MNMVFRPPAPIVLPSDQDASGRTLGDEEIALVTEAPRSATVTATTPVRLLVITGQAFQRLLNDTPSIQGKVLQALAQRLDPELM